MEEEVKETNELEEEFSLEEEEKEKQDDTPPPPVWEQKGFASLEDLIKHLEEEKESATSRAATAEEALIGQRPEVKKPTFNQAEYDEDPEGYSKKFNKEVEEFLTKSTEPVSYPERVLNSAVEEILSKGDEKGYSRHVLYGTLQSIAKGSTENQMLVRTPDGIRTLGAQALKEMENMVARKGDEAPADHKQPKGGSPSGTKQSKPKESEVERLDKEIAEKVKEGGKVDEVITLTLQRNAARLRKERGEK